MKWKEWNIRLYVNKWVPQWQKSKRRMFLSSGYPVYFSLFDISRFSVKYHTGIITYLKEYSKVKKYVWLIPFWPAVTAISARLCNIKYISNFEKKKVREQEHQHACISLRTPVTLTRIAIHITQLSHLQLRRIRQNASVCFSHFLDQ